MFFTDAFKYSNEFEQLMNRLNEVQPITTLEQYMENSKGKSRGKLIYSEAAQPYILDALEYIPDKHGFITCKVTGDKIHVFCIKGFSKNKGILT